jgi:hypothetical protein
VTYLIVFLGESLGAALRHGINVVSTRPALTRSFA